MELKNQEEKDKLMDCLERIQKELIYLKNYIGRLE